MSRVEIRTRSPFYLEKWFLDLVTDQGEAMILYAAMLTWKGLKVPYTSCLHLKPGPAWKVHHQSRFRKVRMPERESNLITWQDEAFGITGVWEGLAAPVGARLFDSDEGFLDWACYQPSAKVEIHKNGEQFRGEGYAERLILTVPPWKIPMEDLRWGRFTSNGDYLVWIQLGGSNPGKWLWYNGDHVSRCSIADNRVTMQKPHMELEMKRIAELEGEKKIFNVVRDLTKFIPGFNQAMPLKFLMADEHKWLSKAILKSETGNLSSGFVIHELVQFNGRRS